VIASIAGPDRSTATPRPVVQSADREGVRVERLRGTSVRHRSRQSENNPNDVVGHGSSRVAAVTGASRDALWAIVAGSREGVLATIGADGLPHLSNVYYVPDGGDGCDGGIIRMSTTAGRAKGRNLLRDPRAVLHVRGADFFNFVVVEGDVDLAVAGSPGDAATNELYAVDSTFNGASERPAFDHRMIEDRRMIVRLAVTKVYGLVHHGRRR